MGDRTESQDPSSLIQQSHFFAGTNSKHVLHLHKGTLFVKVQDFLSVKRCQFLEMLTGSQVFL